MNDRKRLTIQFMSKQLILLKDSLYNIIDGVDEIFDAENYAFDRMLNHQQKSLQGEKSKAAIQNLESASIELNKVNDMIDITLSFLKDSIK